MTDVSIDPNVWGPACWDILFYIAYNVDLNKNLKSIQMLFHLLEVMLPCSQCRRHYALYKKQVPPVSKIKKTEKLSAVVWLWVIHDMVNQNLGKICISYEKLLKKHKSFTCIISDFSIFDTIVFMWISSKNNPKVFEGINVILELLETIRPFKTCAILKNKVDEQLNYKILTECKNDLLKFYDFEQTNETDFIQMYQNSISK